MIGRNLYAKFAKRWQLDTITELRHVKRVRPFSKEPFKEISATSVKEIGRVRSIFVDVEPAKHVGSGNAFLWGC